MSGYNLFPDNDKLQVNGSAITTTSTIVDGGTVLGLGVSDLTSGPIKNNLQLGGRSSNYGSQVIQGTTIFGAFHGSTTTIEDVSRNSDNFAVYELGAHNLVVGDVINVNTDNQNTKIEGVQKVTEITDDQFTTTKKDSSLQHVDSGADSYSTFTFVKVTGRFADMTIGTYLMRGYDINVANGQYTSNGFGSDHGIRRSIHKLEAMRTRRVATAIRDGDWNVYTGEFTTDPTIADDISDFGDDHAATPTRAIPGELVYRVSGQPDGTNGITQDDYEEKTG